MANRFEVNEAFFDDLTLQIAEKGFALFPNFLTNAQCQGIVTCAMLAKERGEFEQAGIGKLQHHTIDQSIRGDQIFWLDDVNQSAELASFNDFLDQTINALNRYLYLNIKAKEMHFAYYQSGTFYKKHFDRFRQKPHRVLTFVLYLNPHWQLGDGGELCMHFSKTEQIAVAPSFGTLILFKSDILHEVKLTHKPRLSLTGWMLNVEPGLTFL